ncbi:MAG TPA: glycoside hydrolase family 15 protein [Chthoniobacter sp.]|jgi:glucoamylase
MVWPGAAKTAVGTAANATSRIWFTTVDGSISEVFFPGPDRICVRALRFFVTNADGYFSDEQDAAHRCEWLEPGVPAFRMQNSTDRYRLEKTIFSDPERNALIVRGKFLPTVGEAADYRLHCVLQSFVSEKAGENEGDAGSENGMPFLAAYAPRKALALVSRESFRSCQVGTFGDFDPGAELRRNGRLESGAKHISGGFVVLAGEIEFSPDDGTFDVAIGFGACVAAAILQARCALHQELDRAAESYATGWKAWQSTLLPLDSFASDGGALYRCSTAVLRTHHGKDFPGGAVASLSIPWGPIKHDPNEAAYHLLWTRDLVEIAGGHLAMGDHSSARQTLQFLEGTQRGDGHWVQNMWLDGTTHWTGIQLDETALPILLVGLAWRERALLDADVRRFWPMVKKAAAYVIRSGPGTDEDRWEQNAGYSISTVSAAIAGLVVAADIADFVGDRDVARTCQLTADEWHSRLDQANYVTGTKLAQRCGVHGYYIWIRPYENSSARSGFGSKIRLARQPKGFEERDAAEIVSPDALALVRFGLRRADDSRVLDTIKVIDQTLRRSTKEGVSWRRYIGDAYGENAGGEPLTTGSVGRSWPLLTGERAHYEIAAGNLDLARELAETMIHFAGEVRLLPEQIWDDHDLPDRCLFNGGATGSSRPLVWAHAEYIKLLRSLRDGRIFDAAPCVSQRYLSAS